MTTNGHADSTLATYPAYPHLNQPTNLSQLTIDNQT